MLLWSGMTEDNCNNVDRIFRRASAAYSATNTALLLLLHLRRHHHRCNLLIVHTHKTDRLPVTTILPLLLLLLLPLFVVRLFRSI